MSNHVLPPPAQMMQLVTGAWVSQAVGAAARLDIADHLAAGAKTADEVARLSGAKPDAVARLMRALASIGVFTMTGTDFALTPLGETLRNGVPGSMRNIAIAETDDAHWLSWGRFPKAIKEGRKMSAEALGAEAWEYYGKHPEDALQFSRAMTDISGMAIEPVLGSYDFSAASKIVDVGGAHGALVGAIVQKHPQATGIVLDLPHVVAGTKPALEARGLSGRVEVMAGDFFKEVPAGADLYLLKHILHDWDDAKCVAILENVKKAMKPTSKVVVVEFALPEDATPSMAHFMDLNMLVMLDGRERTKDQYGALFAKAGLRLTRFIPTPSPMGIAEAVLA
jgi:hypothetical protein